MVFDRKRSPTLFCHCDPLRRRFDPRVPWPHNPPSCMMWQAGGEAPSTLLTLRSRQISLWWTRTNKEPQCSSLPTEQELLARKNDEPGMRTHWHECRNPSPSPGFRGGTSMLTTGHSRQDRWALLLVCFDCATSTRRRGPRREVCHIRRIGRWAAG